MDKKLSDLLFTTRWAINQDKKEYAIENLTDALMHIGALKNVDKQVDDVDIGPVPIEFMDGFKQPEFVIVKGVRFRDRGAYNSVSGKFKGLVVHYTVSNRLPSSAIGVVRYLASKGLGCMVMDQDGKIYVPEGFDIFKSRGAHAGVSGWNGMNSLNQYFAGMEICCWGRGSQVGPFRKSGDDDNIIEGTYQAFTDQQEKSLTNFILWALSLNDEFKIANVCGHDEARSYIGKHGDKTDPGASLSVTMPKYREQLQKDAINLRI